MENVRIVADSSSDMFSLDGIDFRSAALKIITDKKEYVDNILLDVEQMANELLSYSGKSSTACPSAGDWLDAFGDAQNIFCVTITSGLSGSYNAACVAKETYQSQYPDRNVFVLDSLSAGPELWLLIEKLKEYILAGQSFDEVCENIKKYSKKTGLLFILESMRNLANNGRVSPLAAKAAGILGIRAVGKASDVGTLELLKKCRGEKKAFAEIIECLEKFGYKNGKIRISHCSNFEGAVNLKNIILEKFKNVSVEIGKLGGLCSFYAEKGGILIGFEK